MVIPALDLLNGSCVRLQQGDFGNSKIYETDPVEIARAFCRAGAEYIHIVDLNAARGGGSNREIIKLIRNSVKCRIQTGGGIRKEEDAALLVSYGVDRLILGTVFLLHPEEAAKWIRRYKREFYAAIDAVEGKVKIAGWQEGGRQTMEEAALLARKIGMAGIIYTDISRDGMLCGPDMEGAVALAKISGLPVIISGGVSGIEDIKKAALYFDRGISGIIAGKALYEGALNLSEAVKVFSSGGGRLSGEG